MNSLRFSLLLSFTLLPQGAGSGSNPPQNPPNRGENCSVIRYASPGIYFKSSTVCVDAGFPQIVQGGQLPEEDCKSAIEGPNPTVLTSPCSFGYKQSQRIATKEAHDNYECGDSNSEGLASAGLSVVGKEVGGIFPDEENFSQVHIIDSSASNRFSLLACAHLNPDCCPSSWPVLSTAASSYAGNTYSKIPFTVVDDCIVDFSTAWWADENDLGCVNFEDVKTQLFLVFPDGTQVEIRIPFVTVPDELPVGPGPLGGQITPWLVSSDNSYYLTPGRYEIIHTLTSFGSIDTEANCANTAPENVDCSGRINSRIRTHVYVENNPK